MWWRWNTMVEVPQENIIYAWDNAEEITDILLFLGITAKKGEPNQRCPHCDKEYDDGNMDLLNGIHSYATSAMEWLSPFFTAEDRIKLFEERK